MSRTAPATATPQCAPAGAEVEHGTDDMATRIGLIDECLVLNGSDPLGDESAPGADTHIACYTSAAELILSVHPWNCNSFLRQLSRKSAAPQPPHWAYAFELPADAIGEPRAFYASKDCARPTRAYELFGEREVRTDHDTLWSRGPWMVPPSAWPGYLREVIKLLIRSELALSTREDRVMRDKLRADAIGDGLSVMQGGLLATARTLNDMAKPSAVLLQAGNPLIDARTGGR